MRTMLVGVFLVAAFGFGLAGCSSKNPQLDSNSTIRYDPARDGEPKEVGGPPAKGGGKGSKGGGAATP